MGRLSICVRLYSVSLCSILWMLMLRCLIMPKAAQLLRNSHCVFYCQTVNSLCQHGPRWIPVAACIQGLAHWTCIRISIAQNCFTYSLGDIHTPCGCPYVPCFHRLFLEEILTKLMINWTTRQVFVMGIEKARWSRENQSHQSLPFAFVVWRLFDRVAKLLISRPAEDLGTCSTDVEGQRGKDSLSWWRRKMGGGGDMTVALININYQLCEQMHLQKTHRNTSF